MNRKNNNFTFYLHVRVFLAYGHAIISIRILFLVRARERAKDNEKGGVHLPTHLVALTMCFLGTDQEERRLWVTKFISVAHVQLSHSKLKSKILTRCFVVR
jgi:hypothetical protein